MNADLRLAVGHYDMLRRAGAIYDDALAAATLYLRRKLAGRLEPGDAMRAIVEALKRRENSR